jgi:hypothetical protein
MGLGRPYGCEAALAPPSYIKWEFVSVGVVYVGKRLFAAPRVCLFLIFYVWRSLALIF